MKILIYNTLFINCFVYCDSFCKPYDLSYLAELGKGAILVSPEMLKVAFHGSEIVCISCGHFGLSVALCVPPWTNNSVFLSSGLSLPENKLLHSE